jgi:predicted MPP superfamily phosphohydrolase
VAGHTHGGQVRLPFTPDWSWLELVSDLPADGFVDGYGEPRNQLYVSRGVGFSVVPVRLNCRPELTVFTLRSSAGTTPARSKASETSAGTRART